MSETNIINRNLVNIYIGNKTLVARIPPKRKDDLSVIDVMLDVNSTTADELMSKFSRLRANKFIESKHLEKIAGKNKIFDETELLTLLDYLNKGIALFELQRSGIEISPGMVVELSKTDARNIDYIKALIDLHKSGIMIDSGMLRYLSPIKTKNKNYMEVLKDLHKSGIKINYEILMYLSVEKAKNENYINLLKDLHKAGIEITGGVIDTLNLGAWRDINKLNRLKNLQKVWDSS